MSTSFVMEYVSSLFRAQVVGVAPDGSVFIKGDDENTQICEVLRGGHQLVQLHAGDRVLCWLPPGNPPSPGVVLGVIGAFADVAPEETPDELVLEAKHSLT